LAIAKSILLSLLKSAIAISFGKESTGKGESLASENLPATSLKKIDALFSSEFATIISGFLSLLKSAISTLPGPLPVLSVSYS
jgi:hypothetical protein